MKRIFTIGFITALLLGNCYSEDWCRLGQFLHVASNSCTDCSLCEDNEIIKQTCSGTRDTVCEPFYEFYEFLQNKDEDSSASIETVRHDYHADQKEDIWYILTLVLIGCLCISSLLLAVLVVLAIWMYRRRRSGKTLWKSHEGIINKNKLISYDVVSGSDITPCNKIYKPLVVYQFTGNVMQ